MPRNAKTDPTILQMALVGYQRQMDELSAKMSELRAQLGQRGPGRPSAAAGGAARGGKRVLSPAARARIAAAQKARWAAFRKGKASASPPAAKPRRRLSAAGRKAIIEATKKRWAAVRAAKAAAA